MSGMSLTVMAAESVNEALAWGVGAVVLGLLVAAMLVLLVFGAGREHS
jgi:hypothetical protein